MNNKYDNNKITCTIRNKESERPIVRKGIRRQYQCNKGIIPLGVYVGDPLVRNSLTYRYRGRDRLQKELMLK